MYKSIDIFKFIYALMVIGIHSQPFGDRLNDGLYATTIFRIAVPFFFCVSSYLFFSKDKQDIGKYVLRLFKFDVAWTILQSPYVIYKFFVISDQQFPISIINLIRSMLVGESYMGSWYIHASWLGLLILYYMTKVMKEKYMYLFSSLLLILALFDTSYKFLCYNIDSNIIVQKYNAIYNLITPSESFLIAIPYMAIGYYLAKNKVCTTWNVSVLWGVIIGLCAICLYEAQMCRKLYDAYIIRDINPRFECFFTIIPMVFLILVALPKTFVKLKTNTCIYMRKLSILIYLSHQILMMIIYKLIGIENGLSFYILTLISSLSFSIIIIWLSKYFKILKYLY